MDLILWRHADAEDGMPDDKRQLTPKGRKQAARMADWLRARLPAEHVVLVSPAVRAQQTASALTGRFQTVEALSTSSDAPAVIAACGWPGHHETVVVVGHQPTLGEVAARLVGEADQAWSVKKGAVVWISHRHRPGGAETVLRAWLSPDLL